MKLMANLSLPSPFTQQVRFSLERAHYHLSSHLQASKCNTVQRGCLRAGLYEVYVSQGRYVRLRGMRSGFFFLTTLPLTSILELGESLVAACDGQWFAKALQVLSCKLCQQKDSVNSGVLSLGLLTISIWNSGVAAW